MFSFFYNMKACERVPKPKETEVFLKLVKSSSDSLKGLSLVKEDSGSSQEPLVVKSEDSGTTNSSSSSCYDAIGNLKGAEVLVSMKKFSHDSLMTNVNRTASAVN